MLKWAQVSLEERLAKRLKILQFWSQSEERKTEALARAKADVVWFVENWCWTYDPRIKGPAYIPFDPWPKQIEFLHFLDEIFENDQNAVAEKSRDAGLTYLTVYWALHKWLFFDGFKATFASRKLDLVDERGQPDSIFEKIRIALSRLPRWFIPPGFDPRVHDLSCRLLNPQRQSIITGEGGAAIGAGGRSSFVCIDEHAKLPEAESVEKAISENTNCILYLSTPVPGTLFAQKRFDGKHPVFTIHWTDDPRKDAAWYQNRVNKYGEAVVAQELDLNYTSGSEEVLVPPLWVEAAKDLVIPTTGRRVSGLDVGGSGTNPSVFVAREGPCVFYGEEWTGFNTTQTARRAAALNAKHRIKVCCYDRLGVGEGVTAAFEEGEMFADPVMPDRIERRRRKALRAQSPLSLDPPRKARPFDDGQEGQRTDLIAVHVGNKATADYLYDDDEMLAYDRFLNLRAQLAWMLRVRFEKTYEHVMGVRTWPLEQLISIPSHMGKLLTQASLPRLQRMSDRRIKVESKRDMRRRGVDSPDWLDALILTEAEFMSDEVLVGRV